MFLIYHGPSPLLRSLINHCRPYSHYPHLMSEEPLYPSRGGLILRQSRGGPVRPEAGLFIPRRVHPSRGGLIHLKKSRGGPIRPEAGPSSSRIIYFWRRQLQEMTTFGRASCENSKDVGPMAPMPSQRSQRLLSAHTSCTSSLPLHYSRT